MRILSPWHLIPANSFLILVLVTPFAKPLMLISCLGSHIAITLIISPRDGRTGEYWQLDIMPVLEEAGEDGIEDVDYILATYQYLDEDEMLADIEYAESLDKDMIEV